jgi:menaquinone-dependent protoporphyrinogen oxidase
MTGAPRRRIIVLRPAERSSHRDGGSGMVVLVAYASRHGATAGIAERIGARLRSHGLDVEVAPAARVRDAARYDAFVVGGAAYMFHWLGDATRFVRRDRATLASRPTWLFSSGPLGTDLVDEEGRDVFETTIPREFPELRAAVHPRGERVFFGAWDAAAKPIGVAERLMRLMPAARNALPTGDFRDWDAIDAWADEIAAGLGVDDRAARGETPPGPAVAAPLAR